jgi:hypothetical protein
LDNEREEDDKAETEDIKDESEKSTEESETLIQCTQFQFYHSVVEERAWKLLLLLPQPFEFNVDIEHLGLWLNFSSPPLPSIADLMEQKEDKKGSEIICLRSYFSSFPPKNFSGRVWIAAPQPIIANKNLIEKKKIQVSATIEWTVLCIPFDYVAVSFTL